jgi:hypothetical protein
MFRLSVIAVSATSLLFSWVIADAREIDMQSFDTEHGPTSNVPTYRSIRSRVEWMLWWRRPRVVFGGSVPTTLPLPEIDFKHNTLLIADSGPKPSGYSVVFQAVDDDGESIHVLVVEKSLGPGCETVAMPTHPMAMALIPRANKRIRFEVKESVGDNCG